MAEPLLPIDLVKTHLRLERDDEDDYLQLLADAAVTHFETHTGRTLVAIGTDPDSLAVDEVPLYLDISQGLLLLVGHWYENRELTSERPLSEAPAATYALWGPYVLHHLGDVP